MDIRIGTVVEGGADFRVIRNILRGFDIDVENFLFPIRPKLQQDNTDLRGQQEPDQFGSWTNVRNECQTRENIDAFFASPLAAERSLLILQIDADVSEDYAVARPTSLNTATEFSTFRAAIIAEINNWLSSTYTYFDNTIYAVAIQSTDAWLLALHANKHDRTDTGTINRPKNKLEASAQYHNHKIYVPKQVAATYDNLSKNFAKKKLRLAALPHNQSLQDFILSLTNALNIT